MGQTQSSAGGPSGSLENVFPIDLAQDRNLDKLSMVAARILNTPDIYDVNNLSKPGVCGEYAVFLKKEITKKLLPYVVSLPDPTDSTKKIRTEVVYQSSTAGADEATRKAVCSDMVDSMLRVVAIVLACLSSMQIASPSRPRVLKVQKGGAITDINTPYKWLVNNEFLAASPNPIDPSGKIFMPVRVPLKQMSTTLPTPAKFYMLFEGIRAGAVEANFFADTTVSTGMPAGGIRTMILEPVTVTIGPGATVSLLPIRILDAPGATWAAGLLLRSKSGQVLFKSFFADTRAILLDELLYILFRRTMGVAIPLPEVRRAAEAAALEFNNLKMNPAAASSILTKIPQLYELLGYTPGASGPYGAPPPPVGPGYGVGPTPFAAAGAPPPPAYPYGVPPPAAYSLFGGPAGYRPGAFLPGAAAAAVGARGYYHIPQLAGNQIMDLFKRYAKIIPTESTPAVVRAYALRGSMDPETRTFRPNVCDDEYWTKKDLSTITPWATFQFLATKDWSKLTAPATTDFDSEWTGFLSDLQSLYNGSDAPKFNVPASARILNQMSFTEIKRVKLCATGEAPYVGFRKIQDGVLRLQGLYAEHTKRMWLILNSLISIIRDPERKIEVIRLNDAVLAGPSASEYVKAKADEARKALRTYYLDVERTYLETIKSIGDDIKA
jgi:hypothetical protein